MPTDLLKVGQLVDDYFTPIETQPSRYWDFDVGSGVESLTVATRNTMQLRAFLNLLGASPMQLTTENIALAAKWLRDEMVVIEFVECRRTDLALQQVNQLPRSAFIRRDYRQLEDAFKAKSGVNLVASTISATEFRIKTGLAADIGAKINHQFGLSVNWNEKTIYRVKASTNARVVVAAKFAPSSFTLADGLIHQREHLRTNKVSLHSLIGDSRINLPMKNHGLHNGGPYHCSAAAELIESRAGNERSLALKLSGSIANLGFGSPCDGGQTRMLRVIPANWVIEIEPTSAIKFEVIQKATGNFAGLHLHGQGTSSSLVSNVEINCPNSFFVFHPVMVKIYTD